jgi:hypothetical protein
MAQMQQKLSSITRRTGTQYAPAPGEGQSRLHPNPIENGLLAEHWEDEATRESSKRVAANLNRGQGSRLGADRGANTVPIDTRPPFGRPRCQ